MGMRPRTYEHFEAGKGPLYVDRIHEFARALSVDPHAILMALEIGSPEFAMRCADNKLVTIIVMALQDFDHANGDAIAQLDPQTLRSSFERLFTELGELARARAALADSWLKEPPPTPRGQGSDGRRPSARTWRRPPGRAVAPPRRGRRRARRLPGAHPLPQGGGARSATRKVAGPSRPPRGWPLRPGVRGSLQSGPPPRRPDLASAYRCLQTQERARAESASD